MEGHVAVNRGAQVYTIHGELRDSRGHTACEASHGEEEVWGRGEGQSETDRFALTQMPLQFERAWHPPALSKLRGLLMGYRLRDSATTPACSCWFRSCSMSHKSSAPSGRLLFSLSARPPGSVGKMSQHSLPAYRDRPYLFPGDQKSHLRG